MKQVKSRRQHNAPYKTYRGQPESNDENSKPYNQYDQEDQSPAKKGVMLAESAKVEKLEKLRSEDMSMNLMMKTLILQSFIAYV